MVVSSESSQAFPESSADLTRKAGVQGSLGDGAPQRVRQNRSRDMRVGDHREEQHGAPHVGTLELGGEGAD